VEWKCEIWQKAPLQWRKVASESLRTNQCRVIDVHCGETIFSITVAPVPEGGYVNLYGMDITERKKAEEAIRIANERLVLAQQAAGAGLWDWNIETGNLEWSDQLFILFGLDPEKNEAGFDSWRSILHPDDRVPAEKRIETSIENHTQLDSEYRIILSSGEVRWIHCLGNTIYEKSGKPLRMSGICLDITERKKAEEEIRQSNEELKVLMDSVPVGIFFADDPECKRISGNPAAQELIALPPDVNMSKSATEKDRPTSWKEMKDGVPIQPQYLPMQRAVRGEIVRNYEMNLVFQDGTVKSVIGNASPLLDENGKPRGGIAVLMDITPLKKAEEEIRKTNEELRRFNKYAVGREMRMIELKKEVNSLCQAKGEPPRYKADFDKEYEDVKSVPENS
jgi:PAS domain S-box-containing protein